MVEDENEAVLRLQLQDKKAKWIMAADSLAELVRDIGIENASSQPESGENGDEDSVPYHTRSGNGYRSPYVEESGSMDMDTPPAHGF